jgi:hypothetical protein
LWGWEGENHCFGVAHKRSLGNNNAHNNNKGCVTL